MRKLGSWKERPWTLVATGTQWQFVLGIQSQTSCSQNSLTETFRVPPTSATLWKGNRFKVPLTLGDRLPYHQGSWEEATCSSWSSPAFSENACHSRTSASVASSRLLPSFALPTSEPQASSLEHPHPWQIRLVPGRSGHPPNRSPIQQTCTSVKGA